MLGVREARRVAWRRLHAPQHYIGYVTVTDDGVRLAGTEHHNGIGVALTIPYAAISKVRVGDCDAEEVVGERSVVMELEQDEPILVRPLSTRTLDLDGFARRLRSSYSASS
jgi:hypothetical protein